MSLHPNAEKRDDLLHSIGLAYGTLKAAVRTVNIGEGIEGCEFPVESSREIALSQIERIRNSLNALETLVR